MSNSMFDLEDCGKVHIEECKTTAEKLIKGRRIEELNVIRSESGLSELAKLGVPVESLTSEQINLLIEKMQNVDTETTEAQINQWLSNTAMFATLAADLKASIVGAILSTAKLGYEKVKEKISK
ncbi:hypothetical protein P3697_01415 [Vibrio parahaemolyticus]|uniref:hypothetical protein n=1 Tax=Vibrio alginolyticus TaxID=663 RepID=UPI00215BD2FB|nr:hypothetical protein [Vibrio alginolyticus]MCR9959709.1 hypothetical protein [Vibrio alginolyticus]MDF4305905.1 hypothetical protein [Vibrio parahaemolyticus]MDF5070790.1 hypothetical protein [Vibrio parahaemolyticus]MDF5300656.1 hypothetical protein [Vibrio parahaemolyticus]